MVSISCSLKPVQVVPSWPRPTQTWGKRHEGFIALELSLFIQEIGGVETVRVLELGRVPVRRNKQGNHHGALGGAYHSGYQQN